MMKIALTSTHHKTKHTHTSQDKTHTHLTSTHHMTKKKRPSQKQDQSAHATIMKEKDKTVQNDGGEA